MVSVMNENEFNLYEAIASNIKKYRKEANITQAELSERVGVSHEFIRRIESKKGIKTFSVDTLYKISIALNTDIGNLFKFDK
jgi:transcriptional regulator with XRE-family HTH domain